MYPFDTMYVFYIVLLKLNREVVWQEWLGGTGIALLMSVVFNVIAYFGATSDMETWSGQLNKAVFYPQWVERYTETHSRTIGSGKNAHTIYWSDTHYRTHKEHWNVESTLGHDLDVGKNFYSEVVESFGGDVLTVNGNKRGFHSGDPNVYVSRNKSGYIYPVVDERHWKNRVRGAAPSAFEFPRVPVDAPLYEYPPNNNWLQSSRLLGNVPIDILEWDRMNAKLGPSKFVNVIMVNFGNKDRSAGLFQRSKWVGGKQNDLVICYGGKSQSQADWSFVFGWTESDAVKKNIESIVLTNKIDNSILPIIEQEIKRNYVIKDFHKFDYISVQPPRWSYIAFLIVMVVSQLGFWFWSHGNEFSKEFQQ